MNGICVIASHVGWRVVHRPSDRVEREPRNRVGPDWSQIIPVGAALSTAAEADQTLCAFGRRNGDQLIGVYHEKFLASAIQRAVTEPVSEAIFGKFNPHYMFPEGHAFAFTAYQMA